MYPLGLNNFNNVNSFGSTLYNNPIKGFPLIKPLPSDKVDISQKTSDEDKTKKTKKILGKVLLWSGGILAASLVALALVSRGRTKVLQKLYQEKLVMSNLPENINFVAAKTKDEALKFSREVLKIKNVDERFTLDALNYANKGLVDVSNMYKGKLVMPSALKFENLGENVAAYVMQNIKSKEFAEMAINSKMFTHEWLDGKSCFKDLVNRAKNAAQVASSTATGQAANNAANNVSKPAESFFDFFKFRRAGTIKQYEYIGNIQKKLLENPSGVSIMDKFAYWNDHYLAENQLLMLNEVPLSILYDKGIVSQLEKAGIKVDISAISKLKPAEQKAKFIEIFKSAGLKKGGLDYIVQLPERSMYSTIYHEMGHLQDYGKNLKDLDMKDANLWQRFLSIFTNNSKTMVSSVENRFGGITYEGFKEFLDKDPELFKKLYPDLHKFVTDNKIQSAAAQVGSYAKSGIGEFIAEVHAKLMQGFLFPKPVIDLYKQYGGPIPEKLASAFA